jgi:hypothetical protein
MLTEKGLCSVGNAEGVLHLTAHSKHGWNCKGELDRVGGIASAPAEKKGCAVSSVYPPHRVIAATVDRAVMKKQGISQRSQPGKGLLVLCHNRFAASVAAGHHQECRGRLSGQNRIVLIKQKEMEWGIGEHAT